MNLILGKTEIGTATSKSGRAIQTTHCIIECMNVRAVRSERWEEEPEKQTSQSFDRSVFLFFRATTHNPSLLSLPPPISTTMATSTDFVILFLGGLLALAFFYRDRLLGNTKSTPSTVPLNGSKPADTNGGSGFKGDPRDFVARMKDQVCTASLSLDLEWNSSFFSPSLFLYLLSSSLLWFSRLVPFDSLVSPTLFRKNDSPSSTDLKQEPPRSTPPESPKKPSLGSACPRWSVTLKSTISRKWIRCRKNVPSCSAWPPTVKENRPTTPFSLWR